MSANKNNIQTNKQTNRGIKYKRTLQNVTRYTLVSGSKNKAGKTIKVLA